MAAFLVFLYSKFQLDRFVLRIDGADGDAVDPHRQKVIEDARLGGRRAVLGDPELHVNVLEVLSGFGGAGARDGPEIGSVVGHERQLELFTGRWERCRGEGRQQGRLTVERRHVPWWFCFVEGLRCGSSAATVLPSALTPERASKNAPASSSEGGVEWLTLRTDDPLLKGWPKP
jgi:hypothetical protein